MEPTVRVEALGKRYVLGEADPYRTLKETIGLGARRALARLTARAWQPADEGPDRLWALRDVTFEVGAGEVLGIIGRNGAGKSTILKILSRIVAPTEGRAEIRGRVGCLLEVGTGFHPELTGRENVYLNGAILGMRRAEIQRKFDEIVAFAEIERFIDTPVKRYSSGMYTRLAFAVAAHLETDILIVDEVLAVGDAGFQRKCLGKMRDAAGEGRTVLFVSHNMGPVRDLTTRCLLLDQGTTVLEGAPSEVIAAYLAGPGASSYEQDLTGSPRPTRVPMDRGFEFTHVALDAPPAGPAVSEPLALRLRYRAFRAVRNVEVTVAIAHPNGTHLLNTRSGNAGKRFEFAEGETGTLHVRLETPRLSHGLYAVALAAAVDDRVLDWLPEALRFEVMPDAESQPRLGQSLGLDLPATWRLESAER